MKKTLGLKHQNLDRKIYTAVKAMIIERRLTPGSKIVQDILAQELGVSRTPLVNALKKLEHEKLLSSLPRRGFFVRSFTKQEMIQIFELREVMEGLAARRAAIERTEEQLEELHAFFGTFQPQEDELSSDDIKRYAREDREFHAAVVHAGGQGVLADILDTYNIVTLSYQVIHQEGLVRPPQQTLAEHIAIIDAIAVRDPNRAESLIRLHLKKSRECLQKSIEKDETSKSVQH